MEVERRFGLKQVQVQPLRFGQIQVGFHRTQRSKAGFEVLVGELGESNLAPKRIGLLGVRMAAESPLEECHGHIRPCLVDEAITEVVECIGVLWCPLESFEEFCVLDGPQHAADLACRLQGVPVGRVGKKGVEKGSERWSELPLSDLVD